jgi:cell division initiation protein
MKSVEVKQKEWFTMITPVDLETIVFKRGLRGYNVREVQDFMTRITADYEHIYRENRDLKEQVDALNTKLSQYQIMEESLRNAVILAQRTADELKVTAQQRADVIVREAVQQGEQVKVRIREEVQTELQNLAVLKNQVELFKAQFKSFLNSLLQIADRQMDMGDIWEKFRSLPQNPEGKAMNEDLSDDGEPQTATSQTTADNLTEPTETKTTSGACTGLHNGAIKPPSAFIDKEWE